MENIWRIYFFGWKFCQKLFALHVMYSLHISKYYFKLASLLSDSILMSCMFVLRNLGLLIFLIIYMLMS